MSISINGTVLPDPVAIKTQDVDIVRTKETASGRVVMDYIATKKVVQVAWGVLTDTEMSQILDTIAANKPFFQLTFTDAGGDTTITVYADRIDREILSIYGGEILWKSLTITFKER